MCDPCDNSAIACERERTLRQFAEANSLPFQTFLLLDQAFTHSSWLNEPDADVRTDYESLEFLGDAVLELVVSHYLFEQLPDLSPGEYSKLRATVVKRNAVARVAETLNLGNYIRLGKGEEACGGRNRLALLADVMEAVIAAVYLELGWPQARDFVLSIFSEELNSLRDNARIWDYKSMLQNHCQAQHIGLPRFEVVSAEGPDHRKTFEVDVYIREEACGRGIASSKKEAEQRAAHEALLREKLLK